ncbi:UNVERIFIED_CONTAM: glycine dehydrogenase subunit 2 [Brevibacillus sp. OAP136]
MKRIPREHRVRRFHQAKWDEPVIFELSQPGERGVEVPRVEQAIIDEVGDGISQIPAGLARKKLPNLPEISQMRVIRHYFRISQEVLGADFNVEMGQGTCTMKYSPKINERFARSPKMAELHPLQDESTVQGMMEMTYKLDLDLREISGMDAFSFNPGSGTQALFTQASIVRKYFESRGEHQRNEYITTNFSHPSQAATAAVKGFKIIYCPADENGYPDIEKLKELVSERTAAFAVANPEDTGIYNSRIKEFTDIVHAAGGLCCYDQANANGLLGITRAKEAGFDMCFFNLHKTFSIPHACGGPATGAIGVVKELEEFLPGPVVAFDGERYFYKRDLKNSIGKVRSFYGVPPAVLRAYAWVRALGAEGLVEVAKIACLNNNYLYHKVLQIRGASAPFVNGRRLEQVRYSWEQLKQETGVNTYDVQRRMADFAHHYWTSHHPFYVPEPFTLEPTESYSKAEIDEYVNALAHISDEAYTNPQIVKTAPHNSTCHRIEESVLDDPSQWAITWRAYLKKTAQN